MGHGRLSGSYSSDPHDGLQNLPSSRSRDLISIAYRRLAWGCRGVGGGRERKAHTHTYTRSCPRCISLLQSFTKLKKRFTFSSHAHTPLPLACANGWRALLLETRIVMFRDYIAPCSLTERRFHRFLPPMLGKPHVTM